MFKQKKARLAGMQNTGEGGLFYVVGGLVKSGQWGTMDPETLTGGSRHNRGKGDGRMDRLRQLPKEKRKAVMHAAMEVFAQSDYKRASTEEIARKAGISKGLLFYYFKNKQTLYLYLARYLQSFIEQNMKMEQLAGITDFFDLLDYGMEEKLAILRKLPWALEFSVRMYYTAEREIGPALQKYQVRVLEELWERYFTGVNLEKFRSGVQPRQVLDMLVYLTDGYIHRRRMEQKPLELEELVREYMVWRGILRSYAYKEEYQ